MKLIALGDNVIDRYVNTGESFPGGNAVNVAVHAARCGAVAEYLGALGADAAAGVITRALAAAGVGCGSCPVLAGKTTKACLYTVVEGERSYLGIETGETWAGPLQLTPALLDHVAGADIIVSSCNAKMAEQLAAVQALPPIFAYDFGEKEKYRTPAYYDAVCHGIDLAMFSCPVMTQEAFAAFCAPLHRRGVVHVLATMGKNGEMISNGENVTKKVAKIVAARDTMGAGDSFLAAFLCALWAQGWAKGKAMPGQALLAALQSGENAASANCMARGGFGCKA